MWKLQKKKKGEPFIDVMGWFTVELLDFGWCIFFFFYLYVLIFMSNFRIAELNCMLYSIVFVLITSWQEKIL